MAISDLLVNEILKREGNAQNSSFVYRKLKILDKHQNKLIEHQEETKHKVDTNRTQSKHKVDTQPNTKQTQTKHNNLHRKHATEHKVDTQPNTKQNTKSTQTEHKVGTNPTFSSLVGLQRKILIFLFQHCKMTRSHVTQELTLTHIANSLEIRVGSIKTTLIRLEKKGFFKRVLFKNGRGGWSKYELPNTIYTELLHIETEHKLNTNQTQFEYKPNTETNTETNTTFLSSSGISINTTTTDEACVKNSILPHEWKNLDLEPLSSIGFSKHHLLQIAKQNILEPQAVQESIHVFAFDLEINNKAKSLKKSPLDFFMGILRNGSVYAPPLNYKSPKEIALEAFIQQRNRVQELEEKAINIEFQLWAKKLTSDEKNQLVPEETRKTGIQALTNQALKTHFKEKIWPDIAQQVCV